MNSDILKTQTPSDTKTDGEYEAVSSFDRETVEMKKQMETQVYDKVMSDLDHVVWAYGVIFALFAVYGVFLLRRSARLREDLDTLQRQLDSKS
jgi:hypothetical protein